MKINRLTLSALTLTLAACNPFPAATTQDEAPALTSPCPCPDLALHHHPEDPDSPEECRVRSRTGQVMDAGDHPACTREARERKERRP